jgi:hypothetical protein
MKYDYQVIYQLQSGLDDIGRSLWEKNQAFSQYYHLDLDKGDKGEASLMKGSPPPRMDVNTRLRIYLVAHSDGRFVANKTPGQLAELIKPWLPDFPVEKLVLMACYGTTPPSYITVNPPVETSFARMFHKDLAGRAKAVTAYGAMVSTYPNGHKLVGFGSAGQKWESPKDAQGVKQTFYWGKNGEQRIRTAVPLTVANGGNAMDVD